MRCVFQIKTTIIYKSYIKIYVPKLYQQATTFFILHNDFYSTKDRQKYCSRVLFSGFITVVKLLEPKSYKLYCIHSIVNQFNMHIAYIKVNIKCITEFMIEILSIGVSVGASVFTIAAMSIDRYLAIEHSMSFRKVLNRKSTIYVS